MDYSKYRRTGELSDLTVTVDQQQFKVHKFPLFVRSDYFKNVAASSNQAKLDDFPGGAATFETIADYLYGKHVDVNPSNVVPIRLAIDYLKMNDEVEKQQQPQQRSLANIADTVLFDATHTAKARRDYKQPLEMLDQASRSAPHAESAGIHTKLIDSFVDSLAYYLKTGSHYDSYGFYDGSKNNLANNALNKEQLEVLNHLPLNWHLELIKSAQKVGLNQQVLANIIKNYLDSNTGLNPHYNAEGAKAKADEAKPMELISMAADILKVERKLNSLTDEDKKDEKKEEDQKPSNLIQMAGDILGTKPKRSDEDEKSEDGKKEASTTEKKPEESNASKSNLVSIMSDVLKPKPKPRIKKPLSQEEKLKAITDVTNLLNELKVDPPFPMPWLMLYLNELNNLGADDKVKSTFNRWAWDALQDSNKGGDLGKDGKDDDAELGSVPPSIMIQMANDLAPKDKDKEKGDDSKPRSERDTAKFVDLIDRYLAEQEKQDKLTPDTFIKLASAVPKDKRNSYDNLMETLLNLLKKDKKIDPETKNKLLEQIDFSKLSQKTLEDCQKSEVIPPQYVAEAALALCAKLRKELEEQKQAAKSLEYAASRSPHSHTYSPTSSLTQRIVPDISPPISSSSYNPRYFAPTQPTTTASTAGVRTRSIDPPATSYRPTYPSTTTPSTNLQYGPITGTGIAPPGATNKTIYPIPVARDQKPTSAATTLTAAAAGVPGGRYNGRDRSLPAASTVTTVTSPNCFEHSSEFYTNDQAEEAAADYYYASTYSYSTMY